MKCPKCLHENPADTVFCGKCGTKFDSEDKASFTRTLETGPNELTRGTVFAGRYEIIEELGAGGMGRVYRVHDTKLNEEVALKLIKPEIAAERRVVERFRNELKSARKITHKNVCRMYDFHEEGKTLYLTMEYVRGEDLKSLIHRTKALTVGASVSIAHQVAEGLAEAHKLGIIHRDLKPGNIMIDKEGQAKIMDFGIARSLAGGGATAEGAIIGTPEYMSPEQVEGKEADQRADIYALGIIFFEMVTGRLPFEGETPFSIANKQKSEPPPDPRKLNPQIPAELDRVILRSLEKAKEKRYQTTGEFLADLAVVEAALPTGDRISAQPKPKTSREITVKFTPRKLIIPAAALLVLAVAGIILWRFIPRKETARVLTPKRVVVALFENRTGDASLDPLGKMAAESVSEGLLQIGTIEVIPSSTVFNLAAARAGTKPGRDPARALAEATGSGLVVSGTYYMQGQTLQLRASIMDMIANQPLYPVEAASGPREKAMGAVETVRQRIMDVIAARYLSPILNFLKLEVKPPRYEALREEVVAGDLLGSDLPAAIVHLKRALELDPELVCPHFDLATAFGNQFKFAEQEAEVEIIAKMQERLTPLSRRLLDFNRASLAGNYGGGYNALRDMVKLDPDNPARYTIIPWWAMYANRPREAVEIYRRYIRWDLDPLAKPGVPLGALHFLYLTGALNELGEHEEELKEARRGRGIYPDLLNLRAYEARALAALGRLDEVDRLVDEILAMPSNWGYVGNGLARGTPGYVMLSAAEELRAHGHREASLKMAGRAAEWYRSRTGEEARREDTRSGLGDSMYQAERWKGAEAVFAALAAEHPDNINYKGRLGALAARRSDRAEALRIAEELRRLDRHYLYGNHTFRSARIIALLGDKERACALLREAVAQGSGGGEEPESYGYGFIYPHSMDLESLRGYPSFEELIKPKG